MSNRLYSVLFTCLALLVVLAGCLPAAAPAGVSPTSAAAVTSSAATSAPAGPAVSSSTAPTPDPRGAEQAGLPPSCQPRAVANSALYVEPGGRYCFLYPARFTVQAKDLGQINVELAVNGPGLDQSPEPLRASMAIEVNRLAPGSDLKQGVDAFLKQFESMNVPAIKREQFEMGGGPAELLEGVPGRGGSRDVFAVNNGGDRLYHFIFMPSVTGFQPAKADVEELFALVASSFTFTLPGPEPEATSAPVSATAAPIPAGWTGARYEGISFAYPPALATSAGGQTVPAEESGSDGPWWLPVPRHSEITLAGYPVTPTVDAPRLLVYPAADFAKLNAEAAGRIKSLQGLLQTRPTESTAALPFLPLLNATQELRLGVKYLSFNGGQGLRYLTSYGQGPASNGPLLYTFQGLTSDGSSYVALILPVTQNLLPADFGMMPPGEREALRTSLEKKLQANAGDIQPALADLDALVATIAIAD